MNSRFAIKVVFLIALCSTCIKSWATLSWGTPDFQSYIVAPDNTYIDITFTEGVYNSLGGGLSFSASEFRIESFSSNGGNITGVVIDSATQIDGITALVGGEVTIRIHISISGGLASGVETFRVRPNGGGNIFDVSLSNSMGGGETTGNITLINQEGVTSDIIIDLTFLPLADIPYINYQNPIVAISDYHLGHFTLRDGGFTGNDADLFGTTLTDLDFTITNWQNIQTLALFNEANVKIFESSISGPALNLSGLNITANDNGTTNFYTVCTFNDFVTDNEQVILSVTAATSTGSLFSEPNAGGASTLPGVNFIEVVATQLEFITALQSTVAVYTDLIPSPIAVANDALGNIDLDFNEAISLSNVDGLGMANIPSGATNGSIIFASDFQFLNPGDGTLTISSGGLTSVESSSVTVTCIDPLIMPIVANNSNCAAFNGSVSLSVEVAGVPTSNDNFTFDWFSGTSNIPGNSLENFTPDISGVAPGDYFVEVTHSASGCAGSLVVTISDVSVPPVIVESITDNSSCQLPEGSINLQIDGGAPLGNYAITWYQGTDNTGALISTNTDMISDLAAGDYYVEVTDNTTNCSNSGGFTVAESINSPEVESFSADKELFCQGDIVELSVMITGGTGPYSVTIDQGIGVRNGYLSGDAILISPQTNTTYSITALEDSNGCASQNLPVELSVTLDQSIGVFDVTGGGSFCEGSGDNLEITLSGSQSGISYSLNLDGSEINSRLGNGNTLIFPIDPVAGEYSIVATSGNNCSQTMSGTATVIIDPLPILEGSIVGEIEICPNQEAISYSIEDEDDVSYTWRFPAGFSIVAGATTNQIIAATNGQPSSGEISVFSSNTCGDSEEIRLAVVTSPPPSLAINTEDEIFDGQETTFSVNTNVELASINWMFGDGGLSNGLTVSHVFPDPGKYSVDVVGIATNGCVGEAGITVLVKKRPKVIIKNVITPNGDGQNDYLWIEHIEEFSSNQVTFLDRWGVEVAAFENYSNDWDLKNGGDYIPAGNYLCVVKLSIGEVYSMAITVIRE